MSSEPNPNDLAYLKCKISLQARLVKEYKEVIVDQKLHKNPRAWQGYMERCIRINSWIELLDRGYVQPSDITLWVLTNGYGAPHRE